RRDPLGGETWLLAAGGARPSRLEFGPLEGVSAAMRAERAGTEGSGLLRLLHALTQMTVVVFLDEARIGGRLGAHAAFSSCGWNCSGRSRSPMARPMTSGWSSTPRWKGWTLRTAGTVRSPSFTSSTRPCKVVIRPQPSQV